MTLESKNQKRIPRNEYLAGLNHDVDGADCPFLGYPPAAHPRSGLSGAEYFARKHAVGNFGRFYPLHITSRSPRWHP